MQHYDRRILLLDFDGTLGYRDGWWRGCLADVLHREEPSITVTADDIAQYLQEGFPWHTPEKGHPEITSADAWWGAFSPVLQVAYEKVGVSKALAKHCSQLVRDEYTSSEKYHLYDDVIPTLQQLCNAGWQCFVVSNHVPELPDLVKSLGLATYIRETFSSANIGYEKPHPKIFEHVLQSIGQYDRIWMIGDSMKADIQGAQSIGIKGILVRNTDNAIPLNSKDLQGIIQIVET